MSRIVLASSNQGKLNELQYLLGSERFEIIAQTDLDVPDAEETGLTFVENAIIKARNACEHTGLPSIADDSGIEVDALNGQPGIYSARFSGPGANDTRNNEKLLVELGNIPKAQRTARYQCVLVYMRHAQDPTPVICQASWEGQILEKKQGEGGFGYDPLFYVPTHQCSAAELPKEEKNSISHRGQALRQLVEKLRNI